MNVRFVRNNKLLIFTVLVLFTMIFQSAYEAFGQRSNYLFRRCAGANPNPAQALVEIEKDGDINFIPCATKTIKVNGSPFSITGLSSLNGLIGAAQTFAIGSADTAAFSSASTTHTLRLPITAISGSSRTTYFPYFNAANTFAKSPLSFDGASFIFSNTTFDADFRAEIQTSNANDGLIKFGDFATTNYLAIDDVGQNIVIGGLANFDAGNGDVRIGTNDEYQLRTDTATRTISIGDPLGAGNSSYVSVADQLEFITLQTNGATLQANGLTDYVTVSQGKFAVTNPQTPASASATCTTGQIAWDTNFLYVCVSTNTWKRSAISTW